MFLESFDLDLSSVASEALYVLIACNKVRKINLKINLKKKPFDFLTEYLHQQMFYGVAHANFNINNAVHK